MRLESKKEEDMIQKNSSGKGTIMNHMSKNGTGLGLEVLGEGGMKKF